MRWWRRNILHWIDRLREADAQRFHLIIGLGICVVIVQSHLRFDRLMDGFHVRPVHGRFGLDVLIRDPPIVPIFVFNDARFRVVGLNELA